MAKTNKKLKHNSFKKRLGIIQEGKKNELYERLSKKTSEHQFDSDSPYYDPCGIN